MSRIKFLIFDLDGVLVESKKLHFDALNEALGERYMISWEDHLNIYDGLKTNQKLELLTKYKGLPESEYKDIWIKKQNITVSKLEEIKESKDLRLCFESLRNMGYKISCCSNSISNTVKTILTKLNIIEFFDSVISNEDVDNSKPHPEMYWKAMSLEKVLPEETVILEDSPIGLLGAGRSGAFVYRISNPSEVTLDNIMSYIGRIGNKNKFMTKWTDKKMNVLIPMAGNGSRFAQAGYTFPKPLIDVAGKPMIQVVVDNLAIDANYIFIVQKDHREKYNLDTLLNLIAPNCKIVAVDSVTEGAACTTLLAKEFIDNDNPLVIANSDQFVEWSSSEFLYKMQEQNLDGGILSFESTHPKWSYAKVDDNGFVVEVAEKNPISNIATVGIYYWKNGSDYVSFAEQMIEKNIRVNNEFYVCPVFNEAVQANKKIKTFNIDKMWGIGTPEDLNYFLNNKK
jgi:beta-phosphoglucomutase-like phosphatase (HAD superfamily)/dTDP-glucose pyrophosphorylase